MIENIMFLGKWGYDFLLQGYSQLAHILAKEVARNQ